MTEAERRRTGYLVIADISGYTRFVTGTELEHGQAIVEEFTSLVRDCLAPPMRFVKLEGDAVFCCADDPLFSHAERLLELTEVSYVQFVRRRQEMAAATTCTCAACASISSLDLKFVEHRGTYLTDRTSDDIAGPDVIVVHRLLKNSIQEPAYAFLTEACAETLPAPLDARQHSETVAELGEIAGVVYPLRPVLEGQRVSGRHYVAPEDADFEYTRHFAWPPQVLWDYFVDGTKRRLWQNVRTSTDVPNDRGRLGAGATSHCDHGSWSSEHRYVDWRPFDYFTIDLLPTRRSLSAAPPMAMTTEFLPDKDETMVVYRFCLHDRSWWMRTQMRLFAPLVRHDLERQARKLEAILAPDGPSE